VALRAVNFRPQPNQAPEHEWLWLVLCHHDFELKPASPAR
jgi:hypothetical protein